MTRQEAETRWTQMREALDGHIDYEDGWTADMIDADQNRIITAILDALFEPVN